MNTRTTTHTLPLKKRAKRFGLPRVRSLARLIRHPKKRVLRYTLILSNAAMLLAAIAFVLYSPGSSEVASRSALSSTISANPLDQLSASDIAVHVAQLNNLPEATAVMEQADTISGQQAIVSSDSQVAARPQIVSTEARSYRDIEVYVTKEGDTVASIAAQFGVTSDSIIWSNDLSGNDVEPGRELYIPPVNGIVHLVQAGDTVESLARQFNAEAAAVAAFNDTEVRGLPVGQRVVIPGGVRSSSVVAAGPRASSGGTWGSRPLSFAGNTYTYGYCTWHAFNRRAAAGNPIPSNLGNAISWYSIAAGSGLAVGNEPRAGAVLWHANLGGLGHVAYVERINGDGSMLVSDMNYPRWGVVTYRTVPPSEFGNYRFIY